MIRIPPGILDACLIASLTLVLVICIYLVWETRVWTRTSAAQAQLDDVEEIARDIRRSLESLDLSVSKTARSLQLRGVWELSPELRQSVLFDASVQVKGLSATSVIGVDGSLRSVAGDLAPPAINFSDRAYFRFHRENPDTAVHSSEPATAGPEEKHVIILSKRVNDGNGAFAGVVMGSVDLSYFRRLSRNVAVGSGGVINLIDMSGLLVARLSADFPGAPTDVSQTAIEHAAQVASGTYTVTSAIDGRQQLLAYKEIEGFPFIVTYARFTDDIFSAWRNASLVIGGALLILGAFAIFMIVELRRERERRTTAEHHVRVSAYGLAVANNDLEQRISREIQARKETQEKLAKSQRLEALGQLAGGIAHDINNVLQTVTGACALAQTHEAENDEIQRLTTIAIAAADRGSAVTQRLLLFARRAVIKAETVNTTEILDDLQELLSHTLGDNIVLKLDLAGNTRDLIGDRMQLETVIINLTTNARDAMPDGGTITIAARAEIVANNEAAVVGLPPGRYVRLSVADTGMGMNEHVLARAADPFFSTKNVGQGTGLGLSMAKGFTEQSGGKFEIVSRLGEGTTVSLWFPAGETSHVPNAKPAQAAVRGHKPASKVRVLLVDDNIEASELTGEWLVASAYEVHYAESGEEALSTMKAGLEIDLLLTDLSMPGMDGLQLIRAARVITPDLPAILLTGNVSAVAGLNIEDSDRESCLLLQKPIRLTELAHQIENILRGASERSGAAQPGAALEASSTS